MTIEEVILDSLVLSTYSKYKTVLENNSKLVEELESLALKILGGGTKDYSLKDCLVSYMDSVIYIYSTPSEEILRTAAEGYEESMAKLKTKMEPEQFSRIDSFMRAASRGLQLPELPTELNYYQQLELRRMEIEFDTLLNAGDEQSLSKLSKQLASARKLFKQVAKGYLVKTKAIELLSRTILLGE